MVLPFGGWQRMATLGVLGVAAGAAAYVLRFDPTDGVADPTGPCVWHALTGINGPSCGLTRMVFHLLHGDLVQAARHHLVALLAVPVLGYMFLRWAARVWWRLALPTVRLPGWALLAYAVAWLAYSTLLRNLPWAPLAWFDIPNLDP
jgi:hypothetical protein